MKRIAIVGGGIAGLAAAYELEFARKRGADIDWHLYEATNRLGGIVETSRLTTDEGEWILEGGPDGWVSEKPWARDLAVELGLESELIHSNDATRKTYIYLDGRLQALPDRMRMMVPEDLATLESSPLFSAEARQAYAEELNRAAQLKAETPFADPAHDESVATFVRRHFGEEVLTRVAGPLLSGVFGGDVQALSVRAVMAPFVAMEQEHGSLIAALQVRRQTRDGHPAQPIFTSLRCGVGSLVEKLVATLPPDRLHCGASIAQMDRTPASDWRLHTSQGIQETFRQLMLAVPLDAARTLLAPLDAEAAGLISPDASSAVLVTFGWRSAVAATMSVPPGFGFLVPPAVASAKAQLLAATFVDQKFPQRAPGSALIIRAFFGSGSAEHFAKTPDKAVAQAALAQLRLILGILPDPMPKITTVRRWPRSLPQYTVGHLERMSALDSRIAALGNLHLLGNSYRGVGLPDLIRDARAAAHAITESH